MTNIETCADCGGEPRPEYKKEYIDGQYRTSCRIVCKHCGSHSNWFATEKDARTEWNAVSFKLKKDIREINAMRAKLKKKGIDADAMISVLATSIFSELTKGMKE